MDYLNDKSKKSKEKIYKKPELKVFGKLMELTKGSVPGTSESGPSSLCNVNENGCLLNP